MRASQHILVRIPDGIEVPFLGNEAVLGGPPQAIECLIANARDALGRSQQPKWRDGDVVKSATGRILVRMNNLSDQQWADVNDESHRVGDNSYAVTRGTFLFNLADVLAQGPIVIGLNEAEVNRILFHIGTDSETGNNHAWVKLCNALAAYRNNRQGDKTL